MEQQSTNGAVLKQAFCLAARDLCRGAVGIGALALLMTAMAPQHAMLLFGQGMARLPVDADTGRLLFLAVGFIQATGWAVVIGIASVVTRLTILTFNFARPNLNRLRRRRAVEVAHG